jgi:hypothetical protein
MKIRFSMIFRVEVQWEDWCPEAGSTCIKRRNLFASGNRLLSLRRCDDNPVLAVAGFSRKAEVDQFVARPAKKC